MEKERNENGQPPAKETAAVLSALRAVFKYHESSGIDFYPSVDEVKSFLLARPSLRSTVTESVKEKNTAPENTAVAEAAINSGRKLSTLDEIGSEVQACQSCGLSKKRIVPVSGKGGSRIKLFVVGGWLGLPPEPEGAGHGSPVFGGEEDIMLARMFKAIHLAGDEVFVTNIIKCGIAEDVQPRPENVDACVSYLHRQIAVALPQVICTMGTLATKTLLGLRYPLSQLRGQVHQYEVSKKKRIPLIPTYHPNFLLKNPEMKKATWSDLQLMEKELRTKQMR